MDKVLIADDSEGVRKMLCHALQGEGRDLLFAADGEAALEMARAQMPDLVILDVHMPGRDGLSVCCALRGDAATHGIPVLMLTGLGDKAGARAAGANDYLPKPFNLLDLGDRMRALLGRGR